MRTYIVSFVILFVLPVGSGAWIVKRFASWLDDGLDTDSGDSSETGIPFVCANGGILATVGYFQVCFCAPGFTGHYCETKIGCGLACYNGGVCVKQVDLSEFCYCPPGFTGADCSVPIGCSLTCNNGGTCIKNADLLEFCSCPPGFTGSDCSTPIGCSLTCSNGGTCITNADLTEFCDCAPGFTGADCSTPIECSLTCNNGGTCITNADLTQFCDCAPGFTGADCSAAINYCDPNPCGPHGTCQSKSFSHVYCACDQGYGGVNCSLSTSPTGESCTSDIDCSLGVKNSYCSKGLCYCQYGYRYVRDSTPNSFNPYNRRLCTLDCVEGKKLSTDTAQFIAWPANTAIEQDDGIILSNIPDVDACKQACIDNDANGLPCVTAEYLTSNRNCQLGFVRISDAGVSPVTVSSSLGMIAFERPCV